MSAIYDEYLQEHKNNVRKAFEWLVNNIPELFNESPIDNFFQDVEHQCVYAHDASKTDIDEYDAYDKYFYGGNRSYEVTEEFNYAWLRHIHKNEHHWQHWVLHMDDGGEKVLDMPSVYIIEMICDWWSFGFKDNNLYELFDYYEEHKANIKLSDTTRKNVETILATIKAKLNEQHETE